MNTSKLISKANQVISHLLEDRIKQIEKNIVNQNMLIEGCKKIIIWCKTQQVANLQKLKSYNYCLSWCMQARKILIFKELG